jgi:hypothetical protein
MRGSRARGITLACRLWLISLVALCAPVAAGAQRKISVEDSVAAHSAAVEALRRFQYQYTYLIIEPEHSNLGAKSTYGSCEIRVVDFCYGPLNGKMKIGGLGTTPASATLDAARLPKSWRRYNDGYISRYMMELVRLQKIIPGDRWINGELVRMHLEHGYVGRAEDALKKCRDATGWCEMLSAHVMHASGKWVAADSAWSVLLARVPESYRCEWLDPSPLIEDAALREKIGAMSCAERDSFAARFWWLSDPFFGTPGNERRSAHLSRMVSIALVAATQPRVYATPAMMREGHVPAMTPHLSLIPERRC